MKETRIPTSPAVRSCNPHTLLGTALKSLSLPSGTTRWAKAISRRAAARATQHVASHHAQSLDMWVGCGYPKSGTIWLCKLISSYINAPFPRDSYLPIGMRSVIHAHWAPYRRVHRLGYIVRDGRDVMVSMYFHQLLSLRRATNPRAVQVLRRRMDQIVGPKGDITDIRANLPAFIQMEADHPFSAPLNWGAHVAAWLRHTTPHVGVIRYEDLLQEPEKALLGLLESMGEESDPNRAELAVRRHTFNRSGREPGEEERNSFKRKGIAGDWKNHFSKRAAEVFQRNWGTTLIAAGYENDASWVSDTDRRTS